jgi:flagellar motor switch protein FliN
MSSDAHVSNVLLEELSSVLGAMTGAGVTPAASQLQGRAWIVEVSISGTPMATLAIDEAGAAALATAVIGDEAPAEDLIIDTLREVCAQAAGAAAMRLPGRAGHAEVSAPALADWTSSGDAQTTALSADALRTPFVVAIVAAAVQAPVAESRPAASKPLSAEPSPEDRLAVILDIDLPLVVRFGCTDLPLKQLTRLGPGSLIDLGRSPDDPVEVLVSNRVVARGEVVVVSGSYGIRILDIVSARDRMATLEA